MAKVPVPPKAIRPPGPWSRHYPSLEVTRSLQSLSKGVASDGQQKVALRWIVSHAAATYGVSYVPQSDRDTAFMEGRRFVGLQIVEEINVSEADLKRRKYG